MTDFLESWHLFWTGWLSAWLAAATLPLIGTVLYARRQLFLGATVAQSAGLGIVFALWIGAVFVAGNVQSPTPETDHSEVAPSRLEVDTPAIEEDPLEAFMKEEGIQPEPAPPATNHSSHTHASSHGTAWIEGDMFRLLMAMCFALATSLVAGFIRGDAVLALIFLVSSAGAVLLADYTPHGSQEVKRLLGSTLITATSLDVLLLALLLSLSVGAALKFRSSVLLWITAPTVALSQGISTRGVALGFYALCGLTLGLAMYAGGLTYTFACLALPLLTARTIVRRVSTLIWLGPLLGLMGSIMASVVAHLADVPLGPCYAVIMSVVAAVAALVGSLFRSWLTPE